MEGNKSTYTLFEFTSIKRVDSNIVSFLDTAICDNTKIVSVNIASLNPKPPYYGDEMTIRFRGSMALKIGTPSQPLYHLHNGWSYVYNRDAGFYRITDENNQVVYTSNLVKSIADFHIDFNVIKSHQFVIIVGSDDTSLSYIKTVTAKYIGDTIDTFDVQKIKESSVEKYKICYEYDISAYRKYDTPMAGVYLAAWKNPALSISCMFEVNNLENMPKTPIIDADDIEDYLNSTYLNIDNGKVIVNNQSINFFPRLLPIINSYETSNNRPTYEPWMIWGLYDFIYPKHWDDGKDDFILDVFDLSPNWSY